MKPLQSIAMGLVLLLLIAPVGGYDLLPDPLGWVLVLLGVRGLPNDVPLRPVLLLTGALAALVSLPLWVPGVVEALDDADEAIGWAVQLPQFGTYALLSLALARTATRAGEPTAATWWRTALLGCAAVVALPVLVFGGGLDGLRDATGFAVAIVPIVMVVLLFTYAARPWAGGGLPPPARQPPAGGSRGRPSR